MHSFHVVALIVFSFPFSVIVVVLLFVFLIVIMIGCVVLIAVFPCLYGPVVVNVPWVVWMVFVVFCCSSRCP